MGSIRFRKSFKILPGVKVNLNKNSISLTAGVKGAHYTINSNGTQTTSLGIPGTGLSYVDRSNIKSNNTTNNNQVIKSNSNLKPQDYGADKESKLLIERLGLKKLESIKLLADLTDIFYGQSNTEFEPRDMAMKGIVVSRTYYEDLYDLGILNKLNGKYSFNIAYVNKVGEKIKNELETERQAELARVKFEAEQKRKNENLINDLKNHIKVTQQQMDEEINYQKELLEPINAIRKNISKKTTLLIISIIGLIVVFFNTMYKVDAIAILAFLSIPVLVIMLLIHICRSIPLNHRLKINQNDIYKDISAIRDKYEDMLYVFKQDLAHAQSRTFFI